MDDLISREELRKAFKESGYFTGPSLHWARLLIDIAPTVERPIRGLAKIDENGDVKIEPLKPQGEWILCNDRLPNEFDEVLCCDRWGGLMIGHIKKNYHGGFTAKDDCDCLVMIDCLAWMSLPELPKEAENETN